MNYTHATPRMSQPQGRSLAPSTQRAIAAQASKRVEVTKNQYRAAAADVALRYAAARQLLTQAQAQNFTSHRRDGSPLTDAKTTWTASFPNPTIAFMTLRFCEGNPDAI